MLDLDDISGNYCLWPKGVSWPWPKVISLMPRSQCIHTQNPCPGHNSSLPSWIWIIFHTIVAHDSMVCQDFDPRSYLQCQGQNAHNTEKLCTGHNSSLPCLILIINHTIVSWPWLRVILLRSRSQFFSGPLPFIGNLHLDGDDTSHNCCPWPRGCCRGRYLSR